MKATDSDLIARAVAQGEHGRRSASPNPWVGCVIVDEGGLPVELEIDGGINRETAPRAAAAGADILVAGSAIFHADDPAAAARQIREAAWPATS